MQTGKTIAPTRKLRLFKKAEITPATRQSSPDLKSDKTEDRIELGAEDRLDTNLDELHQNDGGESIDRGSENRSRYAGQRRRRPIGQENRNPALFLPFSFSVK